MEKRLKLVERLWLLEPMAMTVFEAGDRSPNSIRVSLSRLRVFDPAREYFSRSLPKGRVVVGRTK